MKSFFFEVTKITSWELDSPSSTLRRNELRKLIRTFEKWPLYLNVFSFLPLKVVLNPNCLQVIAKAIADSKPVAARAIECDFYVDDMISGADDSTSAIQLQGDIVESCGARVTITSISM